MLRRPQHLGVLAIEKGNPRLRSPNLLIIHLSSYLKDEADPEKTFMNTKKMSSV